jgi:ribose 5-phosphate isomerase B
MIYLGADKHGFKAIKLVEDFLKSKNIYFLNLGSQNEAQDITLEELIPKITTEVLKDKSNIGILSCGTGVGVVVGANKFSGIRACLAQDAKTAEYARVYDDCNILCLMGWDIDKEKVEEILKAWFKNGYDGDTARLKMFDKFDSWGGKL